MPAMEPDSQATTPGQDTTPYIRFAIDQLTRDEEVRGSRVYPQVRQYQEEEDYPVERIIPDNGLGYMAQEQQTQDRMSQHMPPNARRQSSKRQSRPRKPASAQPQNSQYQPVPTQPQNEDPIQSYPRPLSSRTEKDVFVAHDLSHAPLRFRPAILRPLWLGLFILLCLIMTAALVISAIFSLRDGGAGLWDYGRFGDGRYFVFQYLPTLIGMLILLWVIQIQVALQRIVPFLSLASDNFHRRSEAVFLELHPMQFLLPRFEHFRAGHPLIGACYLVFWLFTWTIPLLASSFNVRYNETAAAWRWLAVQGVIWAAVVLYALLILALIFLLISLSRKPTGLRWDPRSLADIIALLERSNVMTEYEGSETFTKGDWDRLRNRADRIGYWSTTNRSKDVFYGIGEEGAEARRFSVEGGRIKEKGTDPMRFNDRPADFHIRTDIRSSAVRLRYLPWYLKDTAAVAWIVIATVLLVAFLVVSYVNSAARLGFLPLVSARTNAGGFSVSNFLYSFIPALIGQFLFLTLLSLDYSLRVLRPYIALSTRGGATAEASLLVDYACRLPFSATLAALENKHYQTAILSFVSLSSISIPIIAGGCFWTQYYNTESVVRVSADLPGYYALCVFLVLYVLAIFALLPGRHRAALPHRSNSLAEIISWVYQSPILADRAFNRPQTKPELVARLMGTAYSERNWARSLVSLVRPSKDNMRADSPTDPALGNKEKRDRIGQRDADFNPGKTRYGFGIYVGRDGMEHLGIDRVKRGGDRTGRELVIWENQHKGKKRRSGGEKV
jgi:hypothetical protein